MAQEGLPVPPTDPLSEERVFKELSNRISQLQQWGDAHKLHLGGLVLGMREDTETIEKRWPSRNRDNDPKPYLIGLTYDAYLLGRASADRILDRALKTAYAAAGDLGAKADSAWSNTQGLIVSLNVRVHTLANGQEEPGYRVYYVEEGMLGVLGTYKNFNRLSSPTDD